MATLQNDDPVMCTLSRELSAQYADDSAENTEPRSLRLQVPILRAASSTMTAAAYWAAPSNSCPTTEIITNGDLSSFIVSSCLNVGSNVPE